jgi:hypothetical protein
MCQPTLRTLLGKSLSTKTKVPSRKVRGLYRLFFRNGFSWLMARCDSCNSVLTRTDLECFVCGEPVPGARKPFNFPLLRFLTRPSSPPVSDLVRERVTGVKFPREYAG